MGAEIFGDVAEIGVPGAARQDFIADDQHCGSHPALGERIRGGVGRGCHVHLTFGCGMSTRASTARKGRAPTDRGLPNPM